MVYGLSIASEILIFGSAHTIVDINHSQIPNWLGSEQAGSTKDNPFPLPEKYLASQQKNVCRLRTFFRASLCFDVILLAESNFKLIG